MSEYATFSQLGNLGKLGNQMFQIAMTIAYALDTGKEYTFPKWEYSKYMQKELPGGFFIQTEYRITSKFHYEPLPQLPGNVDIYNSFGQTAKYFAHRWDEIKPYFTLKQEHYEYIWHKFRNSRILTSNTCSVHVRRTDYTTPANLEYHGVMPVSYYEQGAEVLYGTNKPKDITFMICSDDMDWCKQNFNFPHQVFIEGEQNVIDMAIMSLCANHIICNSSFSWWAGWMGVNIDKQVICPKNWFGKACQDSSKDVPVDGWIVI